MTKVTIKFQVVRLNDVWNEGDQVVGEFDTESMAELAIGSKKSRYGESYSIRKIYVVRTIPEPEVGDKNA